eukprot:1179449-Alexandrium_andersonii.AAC.1
MAGWKHIYPCRGGQFEVRRRMGGVQRWLGLLDKLEAAKAALAGDLGAAVSDLAQRSRAGPMRAR